LARQRSHKEQISDKDSRQKSNERAAAGALQPADSDVSEQAAELALRQSEEKFQKAFRASPIGIILTSTQDDHLIDVNDGWVKIMGYSREEAIGKSSVELGTWRNPEDRDKLVQMLNRGEEVRQVEVEYVTKSGKVGVCEVSIGGFVGVGGNRHFVTAVQDITNRKQAEKDLHKALKEVKELRDQLEAENTYLRQEMEQESSFGDLIGDTEAFRASVRGIALVAPTDSTVLIVGESGTGKELVAREIHRRSSRNSHPLIRVNCAAISRQLYESEFFGHVKGAFTGALRDHAGRFELAHGGTILLDEIAEIPPEMQSKLLRVLQEGEYERVGGEETRTTNARVIATTNRNLKHEMEQGRFREDLYYRLSVFPIEVEPLRKRKADIPLLARHFLSVISKRMNRPQLRICPESIKQLQAHDWPGNIRELQNIVERAIITSTGPTLTFDLPKPNAVQSMGRAATVTKNPEVATQAEMKQYEYNNILAALNQTDWRVFGPQGAAALLNIKPTTLASRIRSLGISKPTER